MSPNPRLLGSTDAAAILGLSRWAGPIDVYLRVVEGHERPRTEAMARGIKLEPQVASAWSAITGRRIRAGGYVEMPKGREWQRLSLDYVTEDGPTEIVEIKTTEHGDGWGESEDEIPTEYLIQCQVQLEATGLAVAHVPVLVLGRGLDLRHRIVADAEIQGHTVEAMERFWREHIEPKRPPEWRASEAVDGYLRSRWPKDTAGLRKATPEEVELVRLLAERKAAFKALADDTDNLEAEIRARIADASGLEYGGKPIVTYKAAKDSEKTDFEAVATELRNMLELRGEKVGEVFDKHKAIKPGSRRLLVKGVG